MGSLVSCEDDFLELPPEDSLSQNIFFETQNDFEQAINAAYAPLRDLHQVGVSNDAGSWAMGELPSDNTYYKYSTTYRAVQNGESIADFYVNDGNLIIETKSHLFNDNKVKMLMSNYSFFSAILNEKIFSPSRWYLFDGTDFPAKGNKYFKSYKNLLIKLIKTNNIEVIYTIYPVENSLLYIYFDKNCFSEEKVSSILSSYEILKDCQDFNS